MNEAETRAELIDPLLLECGWGTAGESKINREYQITHGKIQTGGTRSKPLIADYILSYKNVKLAAIEAKSERLKVGEGVDQAKQYAEKLKLDFAYAANGREIYRINMKTGEEGPIDTFPSPEELWSMAHEHKNKWREAFHSIPFEDKSGTQPPRFYQDENGNPAPNFGEYPRDYFDFIIIDECHRGGANDESNWRGIMEYFSPAVQLGLTATPKRKNNADTYAYFGEPVYIYSLKEGINDGFLTPFKVKRVQTSIDEYIYTSDDTVVEGEVEEGRVYNEEDFNRIIEIKEREEKRVKIILDEIHPKEKTLVFCANQVHALAIRDLINQHKKRNDPNYCHRVTANDGKLGEQHLRDFQDNEKSIPTILTTSQKLSTGVDARNIRNIVLLRPVNSVIEFKQIIGRGTRLFEGKDYFTLYDYVGAYHHFLDPEWDGEPLDPEPYSPPEPKEPLEVKDELATLQKLVNAENSDIFDVLEYVSFAVKPMSREEWVAQARPFIFNGLDQNQKDFLDFVLSKYIETGVDELDQEKLPDLISLKYYSITDAAEKLGGIEEIKETFIAFQRYLYANPAA